MFKKIIDNMKLFFYPFIKYFRSKVKTDNDIESNLYEEEIIFINKESMTVYDNLD